MKKIQNLRIKKISLDLKTRTLTKQKTKMGKIKQKIKILKTRTPNLTKKMIKIRILTKTNKTMKITTTINPLRTPQNPKTLLKHKPLTTTRPPKKQLLMNQKFQVTRVQPKEKVKLSHQKKKERIIIVILIKKHKSSRLTLKRTLNQMLKLVLKMLDKEKKN